ncbi:MAG: phage virion morphogenesis protein [Spirochaetaceae bacterium]|jgi:phage gpG-like protein|nr:phage virion morphogenesis protein [Spirochaetaceae bacterium]
MGSVIEVNAKEIEQLAQKLNAYALSDAQTEKLLHWLGVEITEQTKDRFDDETDPEGNKWRKLTEAYAKRKAKKSCGGILVREGYMSKIIFQVNGGASVLVGSAMEYADYHQNAKKKNRLRRFLGLNNNNIAGLSDLIDEFMKGKAGG